MLKCAVQVMRWRDTRAHRPAIWNRCTHYVQSVSNHSWPKHQLILDLKSIIHLRTFSDNGVYVALQLFLVILVSDQWRRVLIPYSYRQAPWGLLHARGMTLPIYMGPTALRGIRAMGDTLSNVESQFFTPYNFGSSRDRTPDLLTTRPTCYHSAMALYREWAQFTAYGLSVYYIFLKLRCYIGYWVCMWETYSPYGLCNPRPRLPPIIFLWYQSRLLFMSSAMRAWWLVFVMDNCRLYNMAAWVA